MPDDAPFPIVHAVTDDRVVASPGFLTAAAQVMGALGPRGALHLRAPNLPVRMVVAHAERLARIQALSGCWLVVNDRVDVALAAEARGAQLTSRSLRPADARRIAPGLRLGASVHALDAAVEAEREGADWVVVGHVYESESHPGEPGRGGEFLARVAAVVGVPAVAIGGVTPERVPALVAAGARGVAAIRGIWAAPHAGDAVGRYLSAHDAHDPASGG